MTKTACGEYSCHRNATQVDVGSLTRYLERTPGDEQDDHTIARMAVCNIHAGALKRVRYSAYPVELGVLSDYPVVIEAAAREDTRQREAAAAERERRDAQAYKSAKDRANARWLTYDNEFEVVQDKDYAGRTEFLVYPVVWGEEERGHYDAAFTIRIEDNQRYDDVPDTLDIEYHRAFTNTTPRLARAIAMAFTLAADYVAERNYERRAAHQQKILEKVTA